MNDTIDTIDTLRAQLAEAQRELIAKEAERAGLELERNNAQRQHTMQCAINKTDSQRILELTAENEQLREQRNRIGLCIDRALNGGKKDDHEAGLGGRMDAIRALRAQLAEAQRDAERGRWLIEHAFQYANVFLGSDLDGNPYVSIEPHFYIPEPAGLEYENEEWSVTDLRAAIDAAKGEPS